jgi:hypothetical protein
MCKGIIRKGKTNMMTLLTVLVHIPEVALFTLLFIEDV